jgi:hypothetical protein
MAWLSLDGTRFLRRKASLFLAVNRLVHCFFAYMEIFVELLCKLGGQHAKTFKKEEAGMGILHRLCDRKEKVP